MFWSKREGDKLGEKKRQEKRYWSDYERWLSNEEALIEGFHLLLTKEYLIEKYIDTYKHYEKEYEEYNKNAEVEMLWYKANGYETKMNGIARLYKKLYDADIKDAVLKNKLQEEVKEE